MMRHRQKSGMLGLLCLAVLATDCWAMTAREAPSLRFEAMDLFVDSGRRPLVAYQVELRFDAAHVGIVGVEGGTVDAFRDPPFFDEEGMEGGRLVLAAFTTDHRRAPKGRSHVARIHLRITGPEEPATDATLMTAASPGGAKIEANVELVLFDKEQHREALGGER